MAGIYVHTPFCRSKCHYCNFFSVVSRKSMDIFPIALKKEIFIQKDYLKNEPVETIYMGGGTPSLIPLKDLTEIINEIKKYHQITEYAEITIEANPDDITPEKLDGFRQNGINRLSIGIQSFFDDDLVYLNRLHSGEKGKLAVNESKKAGFKNISIDLIYGIPGLTDEKWRENIRQAIELDIQHISAYALTVEPGTALDVLIRKKKMAATDEEQAAEQFLILMQEMRSAGFLHYEISNFCKADYFSKHNSRYWDGTSYLGLGPSAHSFNGTTRQWNISEISQYTESVNLGIGFYEIETLSGIQKHNEYIMLSLRTMWGCDSSHIARIAGNDNAERYRNECQHYIQRGLMIEASGVFSLTDEGKLFADGIASDLFLESEDGA